MDDEAMPPGRNSLQRGPPVWTRASGATAVPCVWMPKAFVAPWTADVLGTWLPGSWAIGGMPPDDWIHRAPIQRGGMSGTVRRSSTATPKARAVRITRTGAPGTPRGGSNGETKGRRGVLVFISHNHPFHSVPRVPLF